MQLFNLNFTVRQPFGNLRRDRCVLVAVQDPDGRVLVGTKPELYPPGISRLLGGGVEAGETPLAAAVREMTEELGVVFTPDELVPLARFTSNATDETGTIYTNETTVFRAEVGRRPYQAGDDVAEILRLSRGQLYELADRYAGLPTCLWMVKPSHQYAWADYAKLYAPIHRFVAETINN